MHWDHDGVEHCGGTSGLVALGRVARFRATTIAAKENPQSIVFNLHYPLGVRLKLAISLALLPQTKIPTSENLFLQTSTL